MLWDKIKDPVEDVMTIANFIAVGQFGECVPFSRRLQELTNLPLIANKAWVMSE